MAVFDGTNKKLSFGPRRDARRKGCPSIVYLTIESLQCACFDFLSFSSSEWHLFISRFLQERAIRIYSCTLITDIGKAIVADNTSTKQGSFPVSVLSTAKIFFHRFYMAQSLVKQKNFKVMCRCGHFAFYTCNIPFECRGLH
jgi:CDGSH-type Zn-finger protein